MFLHQKDLQETKDLTLFSMSEVEKTELLVDTYDTGNMGAKKTASL